MKPVIIILTILLGFTVAQGQTQIELISKHKKHKIRAGNECYVRTLPSANDTAKNLYNIHIGYIVAFKDSILTLNSVGLNTIYQTNSGVKKFDGVALDNVRVDLNINKIEEIENFKGWFMAPALVGWLSLVSAVVVSPLVSIKAHSFDTDRFLKVGGISLGAAALSMTVAYGFGRHSFYVNNGKRHHRRLWTIHE